MFNFPVISNLSWISVDSAVDSQSHHIIHHLCGASAVLPWLLSGARIVPGLGLSHSRGSGRGAGGIQRGPLGADRPGPVCGPCHAAGRASIVGGLESDPKHARQRRGGAWRT